MNKIGIILVLLLILKIDVLIGQKAHIKEEPAITQMMRNWISNNHSQETVRAWRIQIITTDDRRQMDRARGKFSGRYPNIPIKWVHESPYYKVQIGAYEKKMDLQAFLLELKFNFPSAIPIMDNVKKTELVQY